MAVNDNDVFDIDFFDLLEDASRSTNIVLCLKMPPHIEKTSLD